METLQYPHSEKLNNERLKVKGDIMYIKITGNYKIVKRYDKICRHYYFDIFRKERLLFTYNDKRSAEHALNTWIEINGRW